MELVAPSRDSRPYNISCPHSTQRDARLPPHGEGPTHFGCGEQGVNWHHWVQMGTTVPRSRQTRVTADAEQSICLGGCRPSSDPSLNRKRKKGQRELGA